MIFDLASIWAALIAFAVLAYVCLDGFDLGIGILSLFWNGNFSWWFSIPIFLIAFVTYIIQFQKNKS